MFKIQYLADPRKDHQPIARRSVRGNVWINIATVKRLSVAEAIQKRSMIDLNARVRIRPVERSHGLRPGGA